MIINTYIICYGCDQIVIVMEYRIAGKFGGVEFGVLGAASLILADLNLAILEKKLGTRRTK